MPALYDNLDFNKRILLDLPFREGVGTITQDVAKPHHPITLLNTPTWTTLDNGLQVLTLNGTNECLKGLAADTADLNFTSGDYSLGAWFYLESGGDDDKTLMGRFLLDNDGWELYHYINEILTLRHHHSATLVGTFPYWVPRSGCYSGDWTFSTWHFMGFSRDGAVGTFYRNGVAITSTCSTGGLVDAETCGEDLYIGSSTDGAGNHYKGKMWRPRIWDVALTADDWLAIYELEKGWFG